MVKIVSGNLLDAKERIICHQVNCKGAMNSGVAKAIREKWPEVFTEYRSYIEMCFGSPLGSVCYAGVNGGRQEVANMFSQYSYGYDGKRYTSYDAFYNCLNSILRDSNPTDSIAFPYKIGCDRGGASWDIIYAMIFNVLKDRDVTIYRLETEEDA